MSKSDKKSANIDDLSFEESMRELEEIVRRLDSGGQNNLEKAIQDYSRGNELKKHCEKKLGEAKMKVEQIVATENGKIKTKSFDENQG